MEDIRLLIVEDDKDVLNLMRFILGREAQHIKIASVPGGVECLEYLQENDADCIISDYQMPFMNGLELLQVLRRDGSDIPFIFVTGQGSEDVAREGFKSGAYDYFTKHGGFAHFAKIINSVEQAVGHRRAVVSKAAAEKALAEEKNKLEAVLANIGDGISIQDREFRVLYQNRAHMALIGDHAGEFCYQAYEGKDTVCEGCPVVLAFADGETHRVERRVVRPEGDLYVEITASPLRDSEGGIVGGIEAVRDVTARRLMEEALRESEAKFRGLVEGGGVGVVIVQDGRFAYVNPRYAEIVGYTPSELMALPDVLQVIHPDDRAVVAENIRKRVEGEVLSIRYQFRMLHKDGHTVHVETHGTRTIFDGRPAVVGSAIDVTERKKAEDELISRNQELHALNSVANIIASNLDMDTTLDMCMDSILSLPYLRVERKGLIFLMDDDEPGTMKMSASIGIPARLRDAESRISLGHCLCGLAARTGRTILSDDCFSDPEHTGGYEGMTSHGHVIVPIKSKKTVLGVMTFYLSAGTRLSENDTRLLNSAAHQIAVAIENRRLFDRLMQGKKEWERTFDAMGELVAINSGGHEILRANQAAADYLGIRVDDITGRDWLDTFIPGDRQAEMRAVLATVSGSPDNRPGYFECALNGLPGGTAGGQVIIGWHVSRLDGVRDTGGETFICCGEDVTMRTRLEEQLRQSQKMEAIGQLAGGIAHDYNNITATIIACANVLELKMPGDDPLRSFVAQILSSAERATSLTQGLLAFGRKQLMNPRPVDLNAAVAGMDNLLPRLIGEDVRLVTSLSEYPLTVMADASQMEQVLMNLATNARDAMPGGGSLTIETSLAGPEAGPGQAHRTGGPDGYALLTVTDTGTGMDEKTLSSIFEPFFTTKEVGKGTGLGLAIVYGIVNQHKGHIDVESAPGSGTAFRIYLPLAPAPAVAPDTGQPPAIPRGHETILLAEDDGAIRKVFKELLEGFGYRVVVAKDGQDAIDTFREQADAIDLIVIDVIMPRRNGREVYEEVKAIRPGVKALFTSGYTKDIIHRQDVADEELDFISKPASASALLGKVREVLDR
ncbi:MAG: response regulator [Nitrospirae bacterium]|nr:response regulator [Nitrospirota bacterium]MBI5696871.1 response regulator [Nitrospirota bacterium]